MKNTLEKMIAVGKKTIASIGMVGLLSCASFTLATRSYDDSSQKRQNAYLNLKDILIEICCNNLMDSYPRCKTFKISPKGFHCQQLDYLSKYHVSHYRWDEIESVECDEKTMTIQGKYDSSEIYTNGLSWEDHPRQCIDLAEAIRIYIEK